MRWGEGTAEFLVWAAGVILGMETAQQPQVSGMDVALNGPRPRSLWAGWVLACRV